MSGGHEGSSGVEHPLYKSASLPSIYDECGGGGVVTGAAVREELTLHRAAVEYNTPQHHHVWFSEEEEGVGSSTAAPSGAAAGKATPPLEDNSKGQWHFLGQSNSRFSYPGQHKNSFGQYMIVPHIPKCHTYRIDS